MDFQIFRSRNFMASNILISREIRNSRESSRPPILFVSARFYCAKLNFTFVTYIYFTVRETSIKMQWKFVSNVVCLIAEFSSFFASCNMPFRITEMLFPSIYYFFYFIIVLFYTPFFLFFFLYSFRRWNFLIPTILPVFHVIELLLNRDCERINSNFGNIQE